MPGVCVCCGANGCTLYPKQKHPSWRHRASPASPAQRAMECHCTSCTADRLHRVCNHKTCFTPNHAGTPLEAAMTRDRLHADSAGTNCACTISVGELFVVAASGNHPLLDRVTALVPWLISGVHPTPFLTASCTLGYSVFQKEQWLLSSVPSHLGQWLLSNAPSQLGQWLL